MFEFVSIDLTLCFDFEFECNVNLRSILCFDCARTVFWLCAIYVLAALDLYFDNARPMFRFSRPKLDIFRLSRPMFWLYRRKLCFNFLDLCFDLLDLCFDFLDQKRMFRFVLDLKLLFELWTSVAKLHLLDFQSRKISRVSKSKNKSSTSTREVFFCVIKLPFKIFEQILVFLTNFKNY